MNVLATVCAAAVVLAVSAAGFAAEPDGEIRDYDGHRYACTGIGAEARDNPAWAGFPLKMVFTNVDGDYLGDVDVQLADSHGRTVVQAHCRAPWLLADLAPGSYTAKVVANGRHEKTFGLTVSQTGQTRVVVQFKEITDS